MRRMMFDWNEDLSHPGMEAPEGQRCICRLQNNSRQHKTCQDCGRAFTQQISQARPFETCFECYVKGVGGGESLFFRNSRRTRSI